MYLYIYDAFLNHKRYDRILSEIETRLNEIGINGKIHRLSLLTNMKDTIEHGIRHGAKTIVILGNDSTFSEAANTMAQFPKITLGFIPIGDDEENILALRFRIPIGIEACDVLSGRIIREIPLGKVNNYFFLISAKILSPNANIFCDDAYNLVLIGRKNLISVFNRPFFTDKYDHKEYCLQTIVQTFPNVFFNKNKKNVIDSIFFHKKLVVSSKEKTSILIDDHQMVNAPAEISIANETIPLIVGKEI